MDNKERWNSFTITEKMASIELFPEEAKLDKDWEIRLEAYRNLGFTEGAKQDKCAKIRLEAYTILGFDEADKLDKDWEIRLDAYQALGFTEEAKKDRHLLIRRTAEVFFKVKARLEAAESRQKQRPERGGKYEKHEHLKSLASDRAGRNPGRKGDGK